MSSGAARLKRRLDEQGINYTNKKAVENFCLIGTPLPPLEKKDANEFVPLWKQEVRDEKGRRRLHGAFTGGFSAGYFNTVGSKEGWAPSTFVSSRSDRVKQKSSRPEDYMDEEDLAELRENQIMSGVKEQQQRDVFGGAPAEPIQDDTEQDSIAASIRHALMPPLEDSAGVRLLKKMGWRPGQGVGPRVSWRTRKIQDLLAAGNSINGVDIDSLDDDEEAKRHLYPPRDTVVPRVLMKTDAYGIGYKAGAGLIESLGQKRPQTKGPKLSAGFGLGALNEADDDDIEFYDSMTHADRTYMPYDGIRDGDDGSSVGRGKLVQKTSTMQQRFPNGVAVLAGFVLPPDPVQKEQWFPVPEPPQGWKPDPQRVWQKDSNTDNVTAPASAGASVLGKRKLTADQRGAILGETPLPSTRSVFDYLSKDDRERIEHAAAGLNPPESNPVPAPVEAGPAPTSIPYTAPHIASAALKGFMPFTNDPAKQARYIAYLRSQTTPDHPELLPPNLPDQTSEAYHKELSDYSKSAAIFKPVSGVMASRFTTAAVVDMGPKTIEGLHQPTHEPEPAPAPPQDGKEREKEPARLDEGVQSTKANAARTGMFGALTREVVPWQPSRLLCKRFGVKDPDPDITTDTPMPGVPNTKGNTWKAEEALAEADLQTANGSTSADPSDPSSSMDRRTARDLENIGLGEDESQGRDTLTYVRPSMDIFKAIFASDDEDSDEDAEEDGGQEKGASPPAAPDVGSSTVPKRPEEENAADVKTIPTHLRTHNASDRAPIYEPRSVDRPPAGMKVVDTSTFKPVFVPRAERDTQKTTSDKKGSSSGGKNNKKRKAIVAFEEDEGAALVIAPQAADKDKDRRPKKKKRRKEKEKGDANAEGLVEENAETWVEKAPPQVVASFTASAPQPHEKGVRIGDQEPTGAQEEGPSRGRKRAIDFL